MQRQCVQLVLRIGIEMHQEIANAEVIPLAQFQKLPAFLDRKLHHAAFDQRTEVLAAHAHIRPCLHDPPERPCPSFKAAFLLQRLSRLFDEILQGGKACLRSVLRLGQDQLKLRVHMIRLKLQRLFQVVQALFL